MHPPGGKIQSIHEDILEAQRKCEHAKVASLCRSLRNADSFVARTTFESKSEEPRAREPRLVFASLLNLSLQWETFTPEELKSALFIFRTKRKSVLGLPENLHIRRFKARKNLIKMFELKSPLLELIKLKDREGTVFWLTSMDNYDMNIKCISRQQTSGTHEGDWKALSTWLTNIYDPVKRSRYNALRLDMNWWRNKWDPTTARFTQSVDKIIWTYARGTSDLNSMMEVLHQSNPSLRVVDSGGRYNWGKPS